MAEQDHGDDARFRPLRPAAGARLVAAIVVGPLAWIVAIGITGLVVKRTDAIELGLLVTVVCFVAAAGVLSLLRAGRRREERAMRLAAELLLGFVALDPIASAALWSPAA